MKIDFDDVQIMNLKPDDTIVYKIDLVLPSKKREIIYNDLKHIFPNNKIVVLDKNGSIEIVRDDDGIN